MSDSDTYPTSSPPPPFSAGRTKVGTPGCVNPSRSSFSDSMQVFDASTALPLSSKLARKLPVTWWHQLFCNWQTLKSLIITNNRNTSSISHLSRQSSWVTSVCVCQPKLALTFQARRLLHTGDWPCLFSPVPRGDCRKSERTALLMLLWTCCRSWPRWAGWRKGLTLETVSQWQTVRRVLWTVRSQLFSGHLAEASSRGFQAGLSRKVTFDCSIGRPV